MLALVPLLALACGGSSDKTATNATSTTTAATAPATTTNATPPHNSTGIASVDAIIAAVAVGDAPALRQVIRYAPVACSFKQEGAGAPPLCRTGEAEAQQVAVLAMAQCEGFYARPDEFDIDRLPLAGSRLYAVYRTADAWPPGAYAVIFSVDKPQTNPAWEIIANDDGIAGVNFGCGQTPRQMTDFQHLTDVLLPPAP